MTITAGAAQRSGFVTGVAWTFIGLAGFATLIAVMQNVMLSFMLSPQELRGPMHEDLGADHLPVFARFMFAHPRVIFGAFLALSAITLVSAVGLLKRQNWARLVFIGIMVLGVVWNLGSLILPFYMFSAFVPTMPESTPQDFRESFEMGLLGCLPGSSSGWCLRTLDGNSLRSNTALVSDACAAALRASCSAAQRER